MSCLPFAAWAAKKAAEIVGESGGGSEIPIIDIPMANIASYEVPREYLHMTYSRALAGETPVCVIRILDNGAVIATSIPVSVQIPAEYVVYGWTVFLGKIYQAIMITSANGAEIQLKPAST